MALKVFRQLKHECQDRQMLRHKMQIYKQLGYLYRHLKNHLKATNCFKKFLQLAWFNENLGAELEAYQNLSIDYFYLGSMSKAIFYDEKFKYGDFEGEDSVVRKVAVGIVKNSIESFMAGRQKEKWVNGKMIKTSFDKMPSPSSFGGGIAKKMSMFKKQNENKPAIINRKEYEGVERSLKPFADFRRPDLAYLNFPQVQDYLPKPR